MLLPPSFLLTLFVLPPFVQLRIFRLARWWPEFRLFLKIVWASLRAVRNPMLLLVTSGFIFTLVGMQLFQRDYISGACRISDDCVLPRWHMGDLFHTFMVITRILCGQWIECLWDCMLVTETVSREPLCISFFMMVVVIGYLLVSQNLSCSCKYHNMTQINKVTLKIPRAAFPEMSFFQMLNFFLILLLTPLSSDSLLSVGVEKNNNLRLAIGLIKDAAGQGWNWMQVRTGNKDTG